MSHEKKVWFITGASSGFGLALAQAVLARGDHAVVTARRLERLQAVVQGHEDRALAVQMDVTDAAARERAVEQAIARFGRIDVLANIAGRGSIGAVEEFSPAELRDQFEINFFSAVEMTRAILPQMRAQRAGRVLTLTSVGGLVTVAGAGAYCAAKFALECWTETLAKEVAPLGIRVTLVEPGAFRTEFAGDVLQRAAHRLDVYRTVVGPFEDYLISNAGKQMGDPVKGVSVMLDAIDSDSPPLRLMLGADAYALWDKTIAERIDDIDAWREQGEATAFDDVQAVQIGR
ncbi:SDR family NAD(P)-dependent oxidoreductase [Burkholderia sp. Bp8963]|uniref:oxidoreductase n=1 Tax=Burkholderia sp. Bp8963 TaxID=2184547 RepID=UPI000F597F59|nr:oxidoreductase [Burkholderia sp. Bp8963]RQS76906.1 SDR family NAD(P)-dependent oxidoreductase [Burkholderia sp. Bp8963]